MKVVLVVALEGIQQGIAHGGHRNRLLEPVAGVTAGGNDSLGRLQAPPVARPGTHSCEDFIQALEQIAAVVDEQQLVVPGDGVPAHLCGQLRVRAEIVLAMALRPRALGIGSQLCQFFRPHVAVGKVIDVRVATQLPQIGDHVIVDDSVAVISGKQADTFHRRSDRMTEAASGQLRDAVLRARIQAQGAPGGLVVAERIGTLDSRIQVRGPIPPDIELAARIPQLLPADRAEVHERIDAKPDDILIVLEVVAGIEHRRRIAAFFGTVLEVVGNRIHAAFREVRILLEVIGRVEHTRAEDEFHVGIRDRPDLQFHCPARGEVMHQRIHPVARTGKVGCRVPVHVEIRAGVSRLLPAKLAEMDQRIDARGSHVRIGRQVVRAVEQIARIPALQRAGLDVMGDRIQACRCDIRIALQITGPIENSRRLDGGHFRVAGADAETRAQPAREPLD